MSWDIINYDQTAQCACGKGKVVRHIEQRDDDWNRSETNCLGEEILCPECKERYHIEHVIRYYFCYPWDGDGVSDRSFLVRNGITIPTVKTKTEFYFNKIDEDIVATFSLTEIKEALADMKTNKFTTKLQLSHSYSIVHMYYKRYKKKSLNLIVPILEQVILKYNNYKWTPTTIKSFCDAENKEIKKNDKEIEKVIAQSFELDFK